MSENNFGGYHTCHTGQRKVIEVGGVELYAGGRNRNGGWQKMQPMADLAMGPSETMGSLSSAGTSVPEGWVCEHLLPKPPLFVSFDWPDFSIPKVNKEFWYALADDIQKNNIKTVSCQCAGGHGRTGVQLAILTYILSKMTQSPAASTEGAWEGERTEWATAYDLIMDVRSAHCEHAVEAVSQHEYIAMVCNLPMGKSAIVPKAKPVITYDFDEYEEDDDPEWKALKRQAKRMDDEMDDEFVEQCPVCESTNIHDTDPSSPVCVDCMCDLEEFAHNSLNEDHLCVHVGDYFTKNDMYQNSDVSRLATAQERGMKVRFKDNRIKCPTCNKFMDAFKFFTIDGMSKECAPCITGNGSYMKKKLKAKENKKNPKGPKDLDKLESPKGKKGKN